ncbi:MAG: PAS domain S-box protein [Candidatus Bathyarchaeia archaeon]|jgi:PAS domain S-box-containing protein
MVDFVSGLWIALVFVDVMISVRLVLMYRKDHDERKLMFAIGLLLISHIYSLVTTGINWTPLATRVFEWCPLPLMAAFIFNLLSDRFDHNLKAYYKIFLGIVGLTIALFFVQLPFPSTPILLAGIAFTIVFAIVQYSKRFDISAVTLIFAMPSFTVCFLAIYNNMIELAIFSAFVAQIFLLLAFEVAKRQTGISTSALVLQQKLNTAKENFSVLFNLLPDPAIIIDNKGVILEVTDGVTKVTGYDRNEFRGHSFLNISIVSNQSKPLLMKNISNRLMGIPVPPYEVEIIRKDGKKLSFEINASRMEYEGNVADLVLFRDLTERNKLSKSVAEKEERFRVIAQNTGDWVWEVDNKGNYVYTNSVVEKILGYTPEEIVGKNFIDLVVPKHRKHAVEVFKSTEKTKKDYTFVKHCLNKSGEIVVLETRASPIENTEGEVLGYRGVDRDITEKREMEKKLVKSERLAAVGELATMVAHDLRNPLQSIATAAYCLEKLKLKEENEKLLTITQSIEDSVNHSDKIVRELLDFSTTIKLEISQSTPQKILNQALLLLQIPSNIKIVDKTENSPFLYVDVDKIRRVCVNISVNAIDAMPQGGTLTISSKKMGDNIEFTFADTGMGMTKDCAKKIMTPFFTTKAKGMGLGLAISKRIAEAHNGKIVVDSKKGEGTKFTLVVPIGSPESEQFVETESHNKVLKLDAVPTN